MPVTEYLKSKIHGACVTEANLDYQGSIGIPIDLMKVARLREYEKVMVADLTSGARLWTYTINLPAGSGAIAMNGAAAHLIREGHKIIIFSWVSLTDEETEGFEPQLIFTDEDNRITEIKTCEINAPV